MAPSLMCPIPVMDCKVSALPEEVFVYLSTSYHVSPRLTTWAEIVTADPSKYKMVASMSPT